MFGGFFFLFLHSYLYSSSKVSLDSGLLVYAIILLLSIRTASQKELLGLSLTLR